MNKKVLLSILFFVLAAVFLITAMAQAQSSVWSWGLNTYGQLGDRSTTTRTSPVSAKDSDGDVIDNILMIAAGGTHTLIIKSENTVWAWGRNNRGQLGNSSTTNSTTAVYSQITDVVRIAAGLEHSLALKRDGTVWAWGYNTQCQLGNSSTTQRTSPIQVLAGASGGTYLTGITQIAAGEQSSMALRSDGTVWAWGYNWAGQLGDNSQTSRCTPVQVHGYNNVGYLTGITQIARGSHYSLALKNDGTVWTWGPNGNGQLGNGTTTPDRYTPVQANVLTNIIQIASGASHAIALKNDGTVWAWGRNWDGQVGNGSASCCVATPAQVSGLTDVIQVACGGFHSMALLSNTSLKIWGRDDEYQLSDNVTAADKYTPVTVVDADGETMTEIIQISGGGSGNNMYSTTIRELNPCNWY